MVTNIIRKFDLYAYSFQKRVYIKDILIRLNVFILWQKVTFFYKYMTVLEEVNNIIEKVNRELIYNKRYIKAEKRFNMKERF